MATEQDEQLVQEIIGKDENLKISGFEANIDEHLENKTDGPLSDSLRMEMDDNDKHTEEDKTEGSLVVDAPHDEDAKISVSEANVDEHSEENKTDGPLVGSLRMDMDDKYTEEDKTEGSLVVDAPRSEIFGKATDLETKEDENLKISGFEANIDEHLDKKTDGPLVDSPRMEMDDKHTEENKTEGPLVDSPHLETLGEVTDRSIKGNEDSKISGTEANIDEHLDKKTDGEAKSAQKARTKFCSLL
ncbi:unnamed protein product [Meloidogyne enterolobii]|uniref:Uncharacterized protein n=1 Tax=Meloidogyne enterolobii TaxID=390850 RepID=A0ACB0ZG16_MELEN